MISLIETILIIIPLAVLAKRNRVMHYNKFIRAVLYFSFVILVIELLSGWLMALHIIGLQFPEPSIFIGTKFWNMLTGPAVVTLYVYIIFELIPEKHNSKKYEK
ncbi:hypothetical protein [Vibrio coralliilyticus]|jgi:uncharacterized membrane protein YeiB|uniref:hypothetical protein n=1 Tax=Vibrio coralliilyticus TaxID=190893 RepID=UPI0017FD45D6|nr:hypothetical protein [Vibrio coralliilyticus]NUW68790.1 hypothetical protein [Vibrio coralliilyticus]